MLIQFRRFMDTLRRRRHLFLYAFALSVVMHLLVSRWILILHALRTREFFPVTIILEDSSKGNVKEAAPVKPLQRTFRSGLPLQANSSRRTGATQSAANPGLQPDQSMTQDSEKGGMSGSTPPDFGEAGGIEIPTGVGGSTSGPPATGTAIPAGRAGPKTSSTPQTPKSSTPAEIDSVSGAEIPGYVIDAAGHRPADAGALYPEVDNYILYSPDNRMSRNVPGTHVCIDGDIIRSQDAIVITETKTDYSKCEYFEKGDDSIPGLKCPPAALTQIVHHDSYLSSSLLYSVRTCIEYDTSNCYTVQVEDSEREICRVDFEYEGLWVEGTKFYHRCLRSEARTYRQPLQYTVRWFMEVEVHERLRRREILRETRTVPVCS